MKRLLVFLVFLSWLSTSIVMGQTTSKNDYPFQKTEITFGLGLSGTHNDFEEDLDYPLLNCSTPLEIYHSGKFLLGREHRSPKFSVDIHHHINKHVAFGAIAAYWNKEQTLYRRLTDLPDGVSRNYHLALLFSFRYYYSIRPKYAFYSGSAMGLYQQFQKRINDKSYRSVTNINVQYTLLGVIVGSDVYGYAELGSPFLGGLRAGIGYRF